MQALCLVHCMLPEVHDALSLSHVSGVLQAADTPKLHLANRSSESQQLGQAIDWSTAVKTVICVHLVCNACKCCFLSFGDRLPNLLPTMGAPWQPQNTAALMAYIIGATGTTWLVTMSCSNTSSKVKVQHKIATRVISLSVAAAQASALICTDWATAFYSLLLLVPLLSWRQSCYTVLNRAHVLFSLTIIFLVFCACFGVAAFPDFGLLLENTYGHAARNLDHGLVSSRLAFMSSWRTTSVSAILTFLLPACIVVLQK